MEEMYQPKRKRYKNRTRSIKNFNVRRFFKKYINFRIQREVQPYIMKFLLIFVIGVVLNYVYYQSFSLHYLFIGGINEWFGVLSMFLNGFSGGYDLFYLIINGIYYGYFYYYLIMIIFSILKNINKRDTWVMMGWFTIIALIINKIFISNIF